MEISLSRSATHEYLSETVDHLQERWGESDRGILRRIFPLLANGERLDASEIAAKLGQPSELVEVALSDPKIGRDSGGRLTELFGLMFAPTLQRIEIEGRVLFSCCALVAQTVPRLIARAIRIESVDPISRRLVRLDLDQSGILSVTPRGAVASMVRTEPQALAENTAQALCNHARYFVNDETAQEFIRRHPDRYLVSLEEMQETAHQVCQVVWGR